MKKYMKYMKKYEENIDKLEEMEIEVYEINFNK